MSERKNLPMKIVENQALDNYLDKDLFFASEYIPDDTFENLRYYLKFKEYNDSISHYLSDSELEKHFNHLFTLYTHITVLKTFAQNQIEKSLTLWMYDGRKGDSYRDEIVASKANYSRASKSLVDVLITKDIREKEIRDFLVNVSINNF